MRPIDADALLAKIKEVGRLGAATVGYRKFVIDCIESAPTIKVNERKKNMNNTVTQKDIDRLMEGAEVEACTMFDKCTLVTVKLENGFVLTESSACVDPANYDAELGKKICLERIENKLWELEGYCLQKKLHERGEL